MENGPRNCSSIFFIYTVVKKCLNTNLPELGENDPQLWENPRNYRPLRFLNKNRKGSSKMKPRIVCRQWLLYSLCPQNRRLEKSWYPGLVS
jgi:hypothetical protein